MNPVSKRIKELRNAFHLSQTEFAEKLMITRGHVGNLETGRATPSNQLLTLISRVFEVDLPWLVSGEGDMQGIPVVEDRERALYALFRGRTDLLLMSYEHWRDMLKNAIREIAELNPEHCPRDVLDVLSRIARIPHDDVFKLAREMLPDWYFDTLESGKTEPS